MPKNTTTVLMILLLAGNVFFYLKYKKVSNSATKQLIMAKPNNDIALIPAAVTTTFNYTAPSYEMNTELRRVKNTEYALKDYAAKNKCNQDYAFVIDMRIPSYKKRFFVYNIKKDSLITSGLVAHGIGSETFKGELIFSNTPDSRCSSLGRYKIGTSYTGLWGFSYRLQGLDSTNNKALMRAVVLHSLDCIPDNEINESPICFSYGCPMVSPKFLQTLKGYISKQGKTPILLEMIY